MACKEVLRAFSFWSIVCASLMFLLVPKTFSLSQPTSALSALTSTSQIPTPAPTGDWLISISGLNDQSLGSVIVFPTPVPTGDWLLSISGGNPISFSTSPTQIPTWPAHSYSYSTWHVRRARVRFHSGVMFVLLSCFVDT